MDLASVVAALACVGVRVSGSTPNNNIQGDSSRACPTGLAGPEPSGTLNDPGQHFHSANSAQISSDQADFAPSRLHFYFFLGLTRTTFFVDVATHPSVFLEGECKCA